MSSLSPIKRRQVEANSINFTILECGDGPIALCLHGFPDSASSWRHLLPALADAGFHAVAPFMRGYAPTSVAINGAYQTAALAQDANSLHEVLGGDSNAVIIGHDWGAPATYGAAISAPQNWRRVVGMSVPPWGAMGNAFVSNLAQLQRSWYMFFFQHPLADFLLAANDFAFIDMLWDQWSPGFESIDDRANAKACLAEPAHLQAALGYYRATLGGGYRDPDLAELQTLIGSESPTQPTLYLHGRNDGCIGVEVADDAATRAPQGASVQVVESAGHFLQLEQPAAVNKLIVDWVSQK